MSVNEKMTAIADAIRDKTKGTDALTLDDMVTEIPKVYDAGKKAEYDAFWDPLQNEGAPTRYYWRFAYPNWNDDNYDPKYDIVGADASNALGNTFYTSGITDTKVAIDATRVPTGLDATFYWARKMQRIRKLIITENTTFKNAFTDCSALISIDEIEGTIGQNISFKDSTKLNKASIESVINALSEKESGLTVTFSKEAVNNAFGIDIDDESTYTEEWNTLRNSKANWTFAYN